MTVLIVGGLDSSTGAGLARDLAVLADHGVKARLAATAVTAQDAEGGCCVHPVPAAMVAAQIRAAGPVLVAKLGMLSNGDIITAVTDALPDLLFVLDPVLATSAGAVLLDEAGRAAMIERLIPRAALVTPNLPEAAILTGLEVGAAVDEFAAAFFAMGAQAVLLKPGHAEGPMAVDWLWRRNSAPVRLTAPRKPGTKLGTGCTLATAIAAYLERGDDLAAACERAKRYLSTWW